MYREGQIFFACYKTNNDKRSLVHFLLAAVNRPPSTQLTQYKNENKEPCPNRPTPLASITGCGNNVLNPGVCDDGNLKDLDTLPKDCQAPVVNPAATANWIPMRRQMRALRMAS
jgi:hypothetical protein